MLATDAAKLRWLGIDMRPRWRRRVVVVSTYATYLALVWLPPWWTARILAVLFAGWYARTINRQMRKEGVGAVMKTLFAGGTALLYGWTLWRQSANASRQFIDIWVFGWIVVWSALSYMSGMVEPVWMRRSTKRWLEKPRRLVSLDDFALHFYGEGFAELTEDQRLEVFRLERGNPLGTWVKRSDGQSPIFVDERLRHEDDRLRAQVQRVMVWVLVGSAAVWSVANTFKWPWVTSGYTFAAWSWGLAALGFTLRQAIVLWTEEAASEMSGEIRLAEDGLGEAGEPRVVTMGREA
jgi:hypothetical protein